MYAGWGACTLLCVVVGCWGTIGSWRVSRWSDVRGMHGHERQEWDLLARDPCADWPMGVSFNHNAVGVGRLHDVAIAQQSSSCDEPSVQSTLKGFTEGSLNVCKGSVKPKEFTTSAWGASVSIAKDVLGTWSTPRILSPPSPLTKQLLANADVDIKEEVIRLAPQRLACKGAR